MRLIKFGIAAIATTLLCQAAQAAYHTNDLYLGFTANSANSDYVIDLGQPSVAGVSGSSVKDLSGNFSLSVFNSDFVGGPDGVVVSVVGGNTTFLHGDVFATQVRMANFGNPAIPGSAVTISNATSSDLTGAANVLTGINSGSGGLPAAGSYILDSTKSYSAAVNTVSGTFDAKSGVIPCFATIGSLSNIVMDLWEVVPSASHYLGFFTFDFSTATPKLNFTPAGVTVTAPVASFTGVPTAGAAPLPVVFTDASTGYITNWIWNFGNGVSVTNNSNVSVTNTYTSGGSYTVSLTVAGPGGVNAQTRTSYITVSGSAPVPAFASAVFSSGKLVISGTNGVASTQYRILMSTNLVSANWIPVFTNQFLGNGSFSYTNNSTANGSGFFRVVSP